MFSRYAGPDRRVHKVYITKHTEYHVREGQVIAVRARGSREWESDHQALSMQIQGRIGAGLWVPQPGTPKPGERIYLAHSESDVVTSPVVAIVRPPKTTVAEYEVPLDVLADDQSLAISVASDLARYRTSSSVPYNCALMRTSLAGGAGHGTIGTSIACRSNSRS